MLLNHSFFQTVKNPFRKKANAQSEQEIRLGRRTSGQVSTAGFRGAPVGRKQESAKSHQRVMNQSTR
jgi:hypothetical protein